MSTMANVTTIARREYGVRVRTRSFIFGTALLVLGVVAIALLPVIIRALDQADQTRIAVSADSPEVSAAASATLDRLLNPPSPDGSGDRQSGYLVTIVSGTDAARQAVLGGDASAGLAITRSGGGELGFVLYTNDSPNGRTATLVAQAANAVAIADRLERAGVAPADQATLFAPARSRSSGRIRTRRGPHRTTSRKPARTCSGSG